ncbi:RNA-directed DNA polymerase [Methylobacterium sp. XJLW]|uniref:RNA-directed DNA polymerase n=1 Tax=Methylobacterium sp. XJLW TaxID=739141 RepID=UPI000DAC8B19|nr:RNA-directed DNA polymerase [Methylobacterium sp. XJLW]
MVSTRDLLMEKGLFPETLPPCFDSSGIIKAFHGIISEINDRSLHKGRFTRYARYVGTKHDGNRRFYATPNPVSYLPIAQFLQSHERTLFRQYNKSAFSISAPQISEPSADRAISISSLSELSGRLSGKIRYAPYLLKTDIAQFFPSIYTHVIPWVAHGISSAKIDQNRHSKSVTFNKLDWYCQQCQNSQTRGIPIGPDAFRMIAESIACEIDKQLAQRAEKYIIGAVRHVDDYYIGIKSEFDAAIVLSTLRDVLQNFELQINDAKTRIVSGLEPIDDIWAQRLRALDASPFSLDGPGRLLDEAYAQSRAINSESPMKLALRRLDQLRCYESSSHWTRIQNQLQRIAFHFPHSLDYICLLAVKRFAISGEIDIDGWSEVASALISRHADFGHHHEICWMLWLVSCCRLNVPRAIIDRVSNIRDTHTSALLIAAYVSGRISHKPAIAFPKKLSSTDENWLHNTVARSDEFVKSSFGGPLSGEFEHISSRHVRLIDFEKHLSAVALENANAISRSKYGYDLEDSDEDYTDKDDEYDRQPYDFDSGDEEDFWS